MADFYLIEEFFDNITTTQLQSFFSYDLSMDSFPEKYNDIFNTPIEIIICYISTKYTNYFLERFKHLLPMKFNHLYMTMLHYKGISVDFDSIVINNYKENKDYLIYENYISDDENISNFIKKYSFPDSFGYEIDFILAKLHFKLLNYNEFIMLYSNEHFNNYEYKHFKISLFFQVWEIYKHITENKENFFENIVKKHFSSINWITMSRLYDPADSEFMEKFEHKIDTKFATQYNKKLLNNN